MQSETKTVAPPSKSRRWGARLFLLGVTLLLCLILGEIGVRLLFPYYRPETQVPFHFTTNGIVLGTANQTARQATPKGDYDSLIHFNADGLRDSRNLSDARESDWFVVGDSYAFGWGVLEEERFSNRLEQQFKTNGISARVFNICIPENIIGYQRLVKYAESRGPHINHLIVCICMENDLRDYADGKAAWDFVREDASLPSAKENVRKWFKTHSALYIAASFNLQKIPFVRRSMENAGIARNVDELTGENQWSEAVIKSSHDEVVKLVAGRQALVVIAPSRHLWCGDNQATEKRIHKAFIGMLRDSGIKVVDLKPAFEAQGDPLNCYFKTDPHWNPHGHAVATEALFKSVNP